MPPWENKNNETPTECSRCSQKTMDDLLEAETIKCAACSSIVWDQGFALKKVKSMTGQDQFVQIPIVFCKICGTPLDQVGPVNMIKQ